MPRSAVTPWHDRCARPPAPQRSRHSPRSHHAPRRTTRGVVCALRSPGSGSGGHPEPVVMAHTRRRSRAGAGFAPLPPLAQPGGGSFLAAPPPIARGSPLPIGPRASGAQSGRSGPDAFRPIARAISGEVDTSGRLRIEHRRGSTLTVRQRETGKGQHASASVLGNERGSRRHRGEWLPSK